MIELEENLKFLESLVESLKEIKDSMNLNKLKEDLKELETQTLEENFLNSLLQVSSPVEVSGYKI